MLWFLNASPSYVRLSFVSSNAVTSVAVVHSAFCFVLFLILNYHLMSLFFQWITSCHKNRMTTRVITLWRVFVKSLTTSVSAMHCLSEIIFILRR